jgi:hypothetical protein
VERTTISDSTGAVAPVVERTYDQSGLLFPREDANPLAGCLSRIARDAVLRETLGRAGRARYLSQFTRDRQLARWNAARSPCCWVASLPRRWPRAEHAGNAQRYEAAAASGGRDCL